MYEYLHYGHLLHPFFSTVICAAVSHPALMSSKILNASAWDDLSISGEISDLTLQQCVITRKLLDDSLSVGEEACSDVTIAALVALILFDVRTFDTLPTLILTISLSLSMMRREASIMIERAYSE
jgi:hypothetical protein